MKTSVIALFGALLALFAVVPTASHANGLDPRIFGAMVQPMMRMVHTPPRHPHPCGAQYRPNRFGGTIVLGNPECGPRYRHNGARYFPDERYAGPEYEHNRYNSGGGRWVRIRRTTVRVEGAARQAPMMQGMSGQQRPCCESRSNRDNVPAGFYVIHQ